MSICPQKKNISKAEKHIKTRLNAVASYDSFERMQACKLNIVSWFSPIWTTVPKGGLGMEISMESLLF